MQRENKHKASYKWSLYLKDEYFSGLKFSDFLSCTRWVGSVYKTSFTNTSTDTL